MATLITLDDGRILHLSNVATDGMLKLISAQVSNHRHELRRWLADVSNRPAPFMDFDMRGFSPADRAEFYAAARRAVERLLQHDASAVQKGGSAAALATLIEMKESLDRGEPPGADEAPMRDFDGHRIDLSDVWDETEDDTQKP